jgi:Rieske Fe-S protein
MVIKMKSIKSYAAFVVSVAVLFFSNLTFSINDSDAYNPLNDYKKARDEFLKSLASLVDVNDLPLILSDTRNDPKIKYGVYVINLPDCFSGGMIGDVEKKHLKVAAAAVEKQAALYHKIKNSDKRLLALELVDNESSAVDTLIYYVTKDPSKGNVYYRGMLCTHKGCTLNNYHHDEIADLENTKKIKLAFKHKPRLIDKTKTLSNEAVDLSGLTLHKTGGLFGNAEISVAIHFYHDGALLQDHTVMLPWAVKVGLNKNSQELPFFQWPENATKAVAVIVEMGSDSVAFDIAKGISGIAKLFGGLGEKIGGFADKVIKYVHEKEMKDDYIGTAVFIRGEVPKDLLTIEETAVFHMK